MSTDEAGVKLEAVNLDAVTFSVKTLEGANAGNCGPGCVYKNSDEGKIYAVPYYDYEMVSAGTSAQARVRNHSWSIKSDSIYGWFNYSAARFD